MEEREVVGRARMGGKLARKVRRTARVRSHQLAEAVLVVVFFNIVADSSNLVWSWGMSGRRRVRVEEKSKVDAGVRLGVDEEKICVVTSTGRLISLLCSQLGCLNTLYDRLCLVSRSPQARRVCTTGAEYPYASTLQSLHTAWTWNLSKQDQLPHRHPCTTEHSRQATRRYPTYTREAHNTKQQFPHILLLAHFATSEMVATTYPEPTFRTTKCIAAGSPPPREYAGQRVA